MPDPLPFDPFNPHLDPAKAAAGHPYPFDVAVTGLVDPDPKKLIAFTPVPRLRARRNGWTPLAQRIFILALSELGCVSRAARAAGMTARGAYRLLEADGAEEFAEAWDHAIAIGIDRLRSIAFDRALNGAEVPVYRKGKLVRTEVRRCNRLAIALLSGRDHNVAQNRERASSRRLQRRKLAALRQHQAKERKEQEAVRAEHQALLDRIAEEERHPSPRRLVQPRIRTL